MKLSGMLVGGLLGAAATMYVARKRPGAFAWASSAVSDACASIVGKTMDKVISANWKKEAAKAAPKYSDDNVKSSAAALEQIEAFVESDPAVKREVDRIKSESSSIAH